MPAPLQPADYVAAFTWDRLITVANILYETRRWVAADAKPERGDSRTGVGFRAWEQSKHFITVRAATDLSSWLSVEDGGARFKFLFGGIPIRFYRGESDEPVPENYEFDPTERDQLELALVGNRGVPFEGYYRIIVAADSAGFPVGVYLAGVDFDNIPRMAWEIPIDADASGTDGTPLIVPQAPVPLPPLTVLTVAEADTAAREEAEREERERQERDRAQKKNSDNTGD